MATDAQIATLFIFFLGLALCFVRWPQADRWHVGLCTAAALLWASCLILDPRTRTLTFGFTVVSFLSISLRRSFHGEERLER